MKLLLLAILPYLFLIVVATDEECDDSGNTEVCKGQNEVYSDCVNGGCFGPRTCQERRDNGDAVKCVKLAEGACKTGCLCIDGYLRNEKNICIPKDECHSCKGPNEVYSDCINGGCFGPRTCQERKEKGDAVKCVKLAEGACKTGCLCKDGYLRNNKNVCIPKDKCDTEKPCSSSKSKSSKSTSNSSTFSSKTSKSSSSKDCSSSSNSSSSSHSSSSSSSSSSSKNKSKGCSSSSGNNDKNKGRKKKCDDHKNTPTCPENEVYDMCPAICPPQKCGVNPAVILCERNPEPGDDRCQPGCRCIDGYLRNDKNKCIPKDQCPSCKGPNEKYDSCANGGCFGARTCKEKGRPILCVDLIEGACKGDCICEDGYLRDCNGVCILEDQCPNTNTTRCKGPNEKYNSCANGGCFGARTCEQKGGPIKCVDLIEGACKGDCICDDGYLRDSNGVCIPEDQCPNTNTTQTCNLPNEVYNPCPDSCPPQTCKALNKKHHCPLKGSNKTCEGACICKDGYFRNSIGECISKENCLKCTGPNEYYSCGGACDNVCSKLDTQNQTNCPVINIKCNEMCYCEADHARNDQNICIPISECPANPCCENEEYAACSQTVCRPKNCSEVGKPIICIGVPEEDCISECVCKEGYVKDDNGKCIPEDQCPPLQCGENEVASDCVQCPQKNCNGTYKDIVCAAVCRTGCNCIDGYIRDDNGTCIPEDQCPKTCCENEEYVQCSQGVCRAQNCSQVGEPIPCPDIRDTSDCIKECICKEGYARGDDGKCIPEDQCPKKCLSPYEKYDPCPDPCPPQVCSAIWSKFDCTEQNANKTCVGSCRCIDGYYRNDNGDCISTENCMKCNGPNEFFACGGACDNVCATLDTQNQTNCPVRNIKCNEMCYCKEGHARDNDNVCVPISECPEKCKGPNEYFACAGACDNVCATLDIQNQTNCPIKNKKCNEMCYCKEGYARDCNNICIPIDECPANNCGTNEEYSTCTQAICRAQTCKEKDQPIACPLIAEGYCIKGCVCKQGYLRDDCGDCIPEDQCPNACGLNEEYSTCTQSICRHQNCTEKGTSVKCVRIDPKYCEKGCVCKTNYLRSQNGTCVLEDDCDICPESEVYNKCPSTNRNSDYCPKSRHDKNVSTKNCDKPRCVCGFNQKRNRKTKKCVAIADCPPFPCDLPNEQYQSCPGRCPKQNCSDYLNNATCPKLPYRIGVVVPCKPECRCKENYFRNSKGICIEASKCINDGDDDDSGGNGCGSTGDSDGSGTDDGNNSVNLTDAQLRFIAASDKFTTQFLKVLFDENDENFICSALSVQIPMAELFLYSTGESLEELKVELGLNNNDEVRQVIRQLLDDFKVENKDIEIDLAQKIYVNEDYPLTGAFVKDTEETFDAKAQNIDCNKPQESADIMNKWVQDNTNNRIKNLVSPDSITGDSRVFLLNGIYFKGNWKYPFNKNLTTKSDFHTSTGETIQVDTMFQKTKFGYGESDDLDCQFLSLPYKDGNYTFNVFLPRQKDGLGKLVDALQDAQKIKDSLNTLSTQTVNTWIPTMELTTTIDLSKPLKANGVTSLFDQSKSGLTGIIKSNESLYVTSASQKAFIKVDEIGSEAAASNVIGISTTSVILNPPEPKNFKADHPFFYCIQYKNHIVFSGLFRNPK